METNEQADLGLGCLVLLGALLSPFLRALVIIKLWGWFIIPAFGLAMISFPVAMGLALLIGFFTYQWYPIPVDKHLDMVIQQGYVYPLTVLIMGWIISFFV